MSRKTTNIEAGAISTSGLVLPLLAKTGLSIVLMLLYFRLVLWDWQTIDEIRIRVVPFISLGIFTGILFSAMINHYYRSIGQESRYVFSFSSVIAGSAIYMQKLLNYELRFNNQVNYTEQQSNFFYWVFSISSIAMYSSICVFGYFLSKSLIMPFISSFKHNKSPEVIIAVIGLIGSILSSYSVH